MFLHWKGEDAQETRTASPSKGKANSDYQIIVNQIIMAKANCLDYGSRCQKKVSPFQRIYPGERS